MLCAASLEALVLTPGVTAMVRTRSALLTALPLLAALPAATCAGPLHTWPAPFDHALSMYVGYEGMWSASASPDDVEAEVEGELILYPPDEPISHDIVNWCEHQVNDPAVPEGWDLWQPGEDPQMKLHVVIRDRLYRLGEVTVGRLNSEDLVGTLAADDSGGVIDGTLPVGLSEEQLVLVVAARRTGETLLKAGTCGDGMDDHLGYPVCNEYAWMPNSGDAPPPGSPWPNQPPYGLPYCADGKLSMPMTDGSWRRARDDGLPFVNDQAAPYTAPPPHCLLNRSIVRGALGTVSVGADWEARIDAAVDGFRNGTNDLAPFEVPPFSRGTAHWYVRVFGAINCALLVPCRKRTRPYLEAILPAKVKAALPASYNQPEVARALAPELAHQLRAEMAKRQCGTPMGMGDAWALFCDYVQPPVASPLTGIKSDVTLEFSRYAVLPGDPPEPLSGTGTATVIESWVTPSPPRPVPDSVPLTFGPDGRCTVPLEKGWKWAVVATPDPYYGCPSVRQDISTPWEGVWRLHSQPPTPQCISIETTRNGKPSPAPVMLQWRPGPGADWAPAGEGASSPVTAPETATYWPGSAWSAGPRQLGVYRARAQGPTGQWSDWKEVTLVPGVEFVVVVDVP
jgi:hypothetical protein